MYVFLETSKRRLFWFIYFWWFFLFQSTDEKQKQQAIDDVQNTDVSTMHYKTLTGDKMTDISDDCDQQINQRDGSSNTLHHDNIDTETVDRKPVTVVAVYQDSCVIMILRCV